jgi:hypothetical protein
MFWSSENKTERLIARYLDPSRRWSREDDVQMRDALRESETLRSLYDKRVVAHRLMLGLDPETPSHVEQDRQMAATVRIALHAEAAVEESAWALPTWTMPLAGMAAAALVAIVVTSNPTSTPTPISGEPTTSSPHEEYLGIRSGSRKDVRAGIGVSGIDAKGREYEVQHDRAWIQDRIRFFYRCEDNQLAHLFLFGLQNDENPRWYYPLPAEGEHASIPTRCASNSQRTQLQGDTLLANRHVAGSLTIVGIFTEAPISHEAVHASLKGRVNRILEGAFEDNLREALSLDENAAVSVVNLWIHPERGATDVER